MHRNGASGLPLAADIIQRWVVRLPRRSGSRLSPDVRTDQGQLRALSCRVMARRANLASSTYADI